MKRYLLFFLLIIITPPTYSQNKKTLLFIGDSFTEGDGVDESLRFTALVGQQLDNVESINQGRSGWPTSAFLRRWEEVEKKFPSQANIIFIQLGGNDLRVDGHNKQTIETCRKNMEEITNRLQKLFPQATIVLMSSVKVDEDKLIPSIREAGFGKHSNQLLRQIGKTYKRLAKEKGFDYIDLIARIPKNSSYDGVHLSEAGHQVVADVILGYLRSNVD